MKGVRRLGIKGKLAPRYIGPYPIIDKYGQTSYQVELAAKLLGVHNVFHVSQIKRCLKPPSDGVIEDTIPLEPDLTYKSYPIKVSTNKTESCAARLPSSTRSNGMITLKMRLRGNMMNSCDPTTPSFFHQGNHPTALRFMYSLQISGQDFLFKEGGL
jgi:hypothetical protein